MQHIWRLIRTRLAEHIRGLVVVVLIALTVSAVPYGFAMLGRWLVDEALQVTGPPEAPQQEEAAGQQEGGLSVEWKAKTTEEKLRLLTIFFVASISVHFVVTGLSALSEVVKARMNNRMIYDLRSAVHGKLAGMEMAVFSREQVGQLMTRVLDDVGGIPGNLTQFVINLITQVAMLGLGLVLLLRLNPQMALVVLLVLPFYAATCVIFLPRIRRNTEELRVRGAEFNGFVVERLANVLTIKNYAQEEREVGSFSRMLEGNIDLSRRQQRLNLYFGTATTLITGLGALAVLALGFLKIRSGDMQLGEVLAFHGVTAQLFVPVSALVGLTGVVQTLKVLADRVFGVLDTPAGIRRAEDAVEVEELRGDVSFENVSQRYQEGGPFAVQDVTLQIPAGKTVCLVGPTGCGKSTLIALLTRLYDPTSGTVRIDGIDVRRLPVRRLRQMVGNVLHRSQVFTGTMADNICYGRPDATREEVEEVARMVGLHEFAQSLPNGYDTQIGRGAVAPDAERLARLGLARALITHPVILTVDDTYSAIAEEAERPLRSAIREALTGRTILIATSRLSLCEDADLVVVMQKGRLVQTGTHPGLLQEPGVYRRLYMRQMGLDESDEGAGPES